VSGYAPAVVRVQTADTLEPSALLELFNAGFADYLVPMRMDSSLFGDHLQYNDIDLRRSPVLFDQRPVAFALMARRGPEAWVGGMGCVPSHRRQGLGERGLTAGLDAAGEDGCRVARLEVIDGNRPAIRLYEKLGFEVVRDVIVWSLPAQPHAAPAAREVDVAAALAWIAAHRAGPEPWQRADESVAAMARSGVALCGLLLGHAGAVVYRERGDAVTVLQIAAVDEAAAADVLLAAAGGRPLRLSNAPAGEPVSHALRHLGADIAVRQHEMRLSLE
jgi:GNAT superfamily N-acetyltransferase